MELGSHYAPFHAPEPPKPPSAASGLGAGRAHAPSLRRVSRSDAHLDIPHNFFNGLNDKGLHGNFGHPFAAILGKSPPLSAHNSQFGESMEASKTAPSGLSVPKNVAGLDRNKSAVELCNAAFGEHRHTASAAPPLRKISSVAECDTLVGSPEHSSLLSSALGYVTGGTHSSSHQPTIPEDQGLTMSVRTANPAFGTTSLPSSGAHLGELHAHSSSLNAHPDESSTLHRVKSGMLGVFNRGFLAKPVMSNPEEAHRYILTMDR